MEKKIKFDAETHTYTINGKEIPSVSTILAKTVFSNKYNGISDEVLKNAAHFGSQVHLAIETKDTFFLSDLELEVYRKYESLIKKHKIKELAHENIVHLGELYCGTYDLEIEIDGLKGLADVKTTYNLDKDYISWQLSLYELASGKKFDKLFGVWLPKRKGAELHEIKRKSRFDLEWVLSIYYDKQIDLGVYYE